MNITYNLVATAARAELLIYLNELYVQKMALDKYFSDFIDENEFDDTDYQTEAWVEYREQMDVYRKVTDNIVVARARLLNDNVR